MMMIMIMIKMMQVVHTAVQARPEQNKLQGRAGGEDRVHSEGL